MDTKMSGQTFAQEAWYSLIREIESLGTEWHSAGYGACKSGRSPKP